MTLLLAIVVFSCVFIASHTAPQEDVWAEDVVSYSGFQLWSATPRNKEEREFILKIRQDYGNKIINKQHGRDLLIAFATGQNWRCGEKADRTTAQSIF